MLVNELAGCVHRVRVIEVKRGPKKKKSLLFYGKTHELEWDPEKFQWPSNTPCMNFTVKMERKELLKTHPIPTTTVDKWASILPITHKFKWMNAWNKERTRKEAGLIWMIWQKEAAVNAWRGKGH